MNRRNSLFRTRFELNMARIQGLVSLTFADVDVLKPTAIFRNEGVRADILRTIVVFLHAAFEDMLNSAANRHKQLSFYSGTDLDKGLKNISLDIPSFRHLYPPIVQMAQRRTRIVHNADLSTASNAPEAWTHVDDFQLIMWLLAVPAFYSLLCVSLDDKDQLARQMYEKLSEAMNRCANFGWQLVAFSNAQPLESMEIVNGLQKLMKSLKSIMPVS
jgi:hypothetical protein